MHLPKVPTTALLTRRTTQQQILELSRRVATGKVLNSTADEDVFVYYTDHGAPGYVTFPAGVAMHSADLNNALVKMHTLGR